MDKLEITGLRVLAKIGVHAWEQRIEQRLLIDITIPINLTNCNETLDETIDYSKVCRLVTTHVQENPCALIETVANQVAALVKTKFGVEQVTVRVSKPNAITNAGNVSVTIQR
jgi:dihydroneopterin aldolase